METMALDIDQLRDVVEEPDLNHIFTFPFVVKNGLN